MALSHSASAPTLGASGNSLKNAGSTMLGGASSQATLTTSLYLKMKGEAKFKECFDKVPPAGRSITVPLADSTERDLQSEIYFPLPNTPARERRYRRISHAPGEIHVHHGLKDQKLPGEEFRYGCRGVRGTTTEDTLKAGQRLGVAEYRNSVAEQIYESSKKEPLGKPHVRGHDIKMLPEGFGNASGVPVDSKKVIFPVEGTPDSEEIRVQYRRTHNSYHPGERLSRNYNMPVETQDPNFRFGAADKAPPNASVAMVLNEDVDDEGTYKKTRVVQRGVEDYRHVQHPKLFEKLHQKQGATGPPLHEHHRYGVKSSISDYTAESCIKGYYNLKEQLPDQDLGRCTKPGRRNVTTEMRAFGVPSVRTDISAPPPGARSLADICSYGDECSAAALLNPQRFDNKGIPDREFLVRRPKEELQALLEGVHSKVDDVDFEYLWEEAVKLFDDGLPLVSLDAILYVHTGVVENVVSQRLAR